MKITVYRHKVEAELSDVCNDILQVLDEHLIPAAQAGESKVFYHKMYGVPSLSLSSISIFDHVFADMFFPLIRSRIFLGKEITIDTSLNLQEEKVVVLRRTQLMNRTKRLPRSPRPNSPPLIRSDSDSR